MWGPGNREQRTIDSIVYATNNARKFVSHISNRIFKTFLCATIFMFKMADFKNRLGITRRSLPNCKQSQNPHKMPNELAIRWSINVPKTTHKRSIIDSQTFLKRSISLRSHAKRGRGLGKKVTKCNKGEGSVKRVTSLTPKNSFAVFHFLFLEN